MKLTNKNKKLLKVTVAHVQALYKHNQQMRDIGFDLNCSLCEDLNFAAAELIEAVAKATGTSDWLDWFINENDFGAGGLEAGHNKQMIQVNSLADLFNVIEMPQTP